MWTLTSPRNAPFSKAVGAKFFSLALLCCLPLRHLRLTSPYGYRLHPIYHSARLHTGIDLAASSDTVFTVLDGVVTDCRYDPGLGLYVRVAHCGSFETVYGHLSQWFALPGDTVHAGEAIALSGATGATTGPHLHFAVQLNKKYIDPLQFLWRMVNTDTTFIKH